MFNSYESEFKDLMDTIDQLSLQEALII